MIIRKRHWDSTLAPSVVVCIQTQLAVSAYRYAASITQDSTVGAITVRSVIIADDIFCNAHESYTNFVHIARAQEDILDALKVSTDVVQTYILLYKHITICIF